MLTDTEKKNQYLRKLFLTYFEDDFHPNKKLISSFININYNSFKLWTNNNFDLSSENLVKVERFLENRGYKSEVLT